MRDDDRINYYYKFSTIDHVSEEYLKRVGQKNTRKSSFSDYFRNLWLALAFKLGQRLIKTRQVQR